MPLNRNALLRYRTIDECLRNPYRTWTLADLVKACSEALYEYEGIDKGISPRTVQMDIQTMRSDKLGYNAPIVVVDKKYYTYADPTYSIRNIPIRKQDLDTLNEVVAILGQFKGFQHFRELSGIVEKLEDKVKREQGQKNTLIDFEKNENLRGLEHIEPIYRHLSQEKALELTYQSFRSPQAKTFVFHPYLLKEYRNRWFVLGSRDGNSSLQNLALDRISQIKSASKAYQSPPPESIQGYFKDVIGVSVNPTQLPQNIHLWFSPKTSPYVKTKPLHHSQMILEDGPSGMIIQLKLQINFELEREILGFGEEVQVLKPKRLQQKIRHRLEFAAERYKSGILSHSLAQKIKGYQAQGFYVFPYAYTQKTRQLLEFLISKYFEKPLIDHSFPTNILEEIPRLKSLLINANISKLLQNLNPEAELRQSYLVGNVKAQAELFEWHQGSPLSSQTLPASGFRLLLFLTVPPSADFHYQLLPGSHKNKLSAEKIKIISENAQARKVDIEAFNLYLIHPLLVTRFSTCTTGSYPPYLELDFFPSAFLEG